MRGKNQSIKTNPEITQMSEDRDNKAVTMTIPHVQETKDKHIKLRCEGYKKILIEL